MAGDGSWVGLALGAGFSLWLVATVVNSTTWGFQRLGGRGFHHLLPRWNFFAPNPGVVDYHLLCRDEYLAGGVGPWREVPGFQRSRNATAAVWNPNKYAEKALFDLTQALVRTREVDDTDAETGGDGESVGDPELAPVRSESVKLTTPYIALLNYVASLDRSEMAVATQFMILRDSPADGTVEPVFLSDFHDLPT